MEASERTQPGAHVDGDATHFALVSTIAQRCELRLHDQGGGSGRTLPMQATGDGRFAVRVPGVGQGALYRFVLDGRELPDPYARFLPHGVDGPAMVVAPRRRPGARAVRPPNGRDVIYELHIGTFTSEGTFTAAAQRLPELVELGVTTLEIMPIAAFAGARGWGYDGVALFAPFAGYGTPDDVVAFVDAAHAAGLSVLLDAVYNHFGPAGNYLSAYCPEYFTSDFTNAWGDAPDFRFPPMRQLVLANVRQWLGEYGFDGLRLDAVHAIVDPSPRNVVAELVETARAVRPGALLIAEDDRNDPALVHELGLDAIWADDFHHQLHVLLTNERDGYYTAYQPNVADLARTIERGWLYEGQVFRPHQQPRGKPAPALPARSFVYCVQNHDQVGNRALGERLSHQVSIDAFRLASTVLLFLPMTPLLFMGQEWACSTPFRYFTDHEPELGAKIVEGRRGEFASFAAFADPAARERIPDPQAEQTFTGSVLRWDERDAEPHRSVLALHRHLLALRKSDPVLASAERGDLSARADGELLIVRLANTAGARTLLANFAGTARALPEPFAGQRVLGGHLDGSELPALGAVVLAEESA